MTELAAMIDSVLACPVCGGTLQQRVGDSIKCSTCGNEFPVVEGVAVLVPAIGAASSSFYSVADEARFGRGAGMSDQYAGPVRDFLARIPRNALVVEIGSGAGAFEQSHP